MNREQKAAAVAEIAESIKEADAVFAIDYRGISVPQAAELRTRLRDVDASFRVVKNSLTERAVDEVGADALKALLEGPTALTFVRGDAALAAKALQTFRRETDRLEFKGGLLGAEAVDTEQILALARLPARDVLYGQLVGVVASPISGLVRTLNALIAGLALQLGQIAEKKESGEIPAGEPPAAAAEPAAEAEAPRLRPTLLLPRRRLLLPRRRLLLPRRRLLLPRRRLPLPRRRLLLPRPTLPPRPTPLLSKPTLPLPTLPPPRRRLPSRRRRPRRRRPRPRPRRLRPTSRRPRPLRTPPLRPLTPRRIRSNHGHHHC